MDAVRGESFGPLGSSVVELEEDDSEARDYDEREQDEQREVRAPHHPRDLQRPLTPGGDREFVRDGDDDGRGRDRRAYRRLSDYLDRVQTSCQTANARPCDRADRALYRRN